MIEGIEPLYQEIAESINEAIQDEWDTAKMEAVFFCDAIDYYGEYTRKVNGVARGFQTILRGERAFRDLRKLFKDVGQPLWCKACFDLDENGKFNMKFEYDDCDDDGFARFDEIEQLRQDEERNQRLSSN